MARFITLVLAFLWFGSAQPSVLGAEVHQVIGISNQGNRFLSLELGGSAPAVFNPYFDLYLLETSDDLTSWKPLASLTRTNTSMDPLRYIDTNASLALSGFYRAHSNSLITPFPLPTGPFAVGTFVRALTDPSRTNRYNIATNSSFMATIWYPAKRIAGTLPALYTDWRLANHQPYWSTFTNVVPAFVSHAISNAPVVDGSEMFPIIVYSHGLADGISEGGTGGGVRGENTATASELASHGYVVIAIDHVDCYGSVFPDGTRVLRNQRFNLSGLAQRLLDIPFVLRELSRFAQSDPVLAHRLDLYRIGMMGWSFGGGTAAEAGRTNEQIKAVVFLDGYLDPVPALNLGLQKPFLAMSSPSSGLGAAATTLFNKTTNTAYTLQISNSIHETYTDQAWITDHTTAARDAARTKDACAVSFFDRVLKGLDDHLLDNPAAVFPNAFAFQTKALRIVTPPQSRNASRGTSVTFGISATSGRPIAYQWQFNGTDLLGAVTNTLVLTNVQSVSEGDYSVIVSDGLTILTSRTATLTVGDRPAITIQPLSQTAVTGSDVTFSVTAAGTLPLSFRWRNPNTVTNMILQTNVSLLTIPNVQFNTPSNYTVVVTNLFGSSTLSGTAVLSVVNP